MAAVVITQTLGQPAVAHAGIGVTFDAHNGGWIILSHKGGKSTSIPVDRVKGVYALEPEPK